MQSFDLSRFHQCSIRPILLVDLLRLPEFRAALDNYTGIVTDAWVIRTAERIERDLRSTPEYVEKIIVTYGVDGFHKHQNKQIRCHKTLKKIRKELAQHGAENS